MKGHDMIYDIGMERAVKSQMAIQRREWYSSVVTLPGTSPQLLENSLRKH